MAPHCVAAVRGLRSLFVRVMRPSWQGRAVRALWLAVGLPLCFVGSAVGARLALRAAAAQALADAGVTGAFDDVWFGGTRVYATGGWLQRGSFQLRANVVEVELEGVRPTRINVRGGDLFVDIGESRSSSDRRVGHTAVALDGVHVTTTGALSAEAWGVSGTPERLAIQRASAKHAGTQLDARDVVLEPKARSARLASLSATVDVDALTKAAPVFAPTNGVAPSRSPVRVIEKLLDGVERAARSLQRGEPLRVEADEATVTLLSRGQSLRVGPGRLFGARDGTGFRLRLDAPRGVSLDLHVPSSKPTLEAKLRGGPLPLSLLGLRSGDLKLHRIEDTSAFVRGDLEASAAAVRFSGEVRITKLAFDDRRLASRPLEPIDVSLAGTFSVERTPTVLTVQQAELHVGKVAGTLDARASVDADHFELRTTLGVPMVACSDLVSSVPASAVPLLSELRFDGTFQLNATLTLDSRRLEDGKLDWKLRHSCRPTAFSARVAPSRFSLPFTYEVLDAAGKPATRETGPGTASWTAAGDLPPHLTTALLVCEDGAFFGHDGFDQSAIRNSILMNIAAGRFVRGGSTVSMQLAKNLYLGRDKTLSRKLQEAGLTVLLEQQLGKERIVELYWNVVELGPNLYGVREAAQHYFRSSPRDLSLMQSLFLGSILPAPRAPHFVADGKLHPRWADHLRRLAKKARQVGRITEDELDDALEEEVRFGVPAPRPSGSDADATVPPNAPRPPPDAPPEPSE